MADSDGEYVADDLSDDEVVEQAGSSTYDTRGAARGAPAAASASRSRGGAAGDKAGGGKGKRKKKPANKAAWEDLQRSWDVVVESEDGNLSIEGLIEAEKRRRVLRDTTPIQRGIIRHLVLVIDMSFAMAEKDLLPTRYRLTVAYAVEFVREYFEQNPISQLGIVGMRDGLAVRISDMSGNPADHMGRLRALVDQEPQGVPSLQNALEMCRGWLFNAPSHGTREILIIYGALLSMDPGDIHDTIEHLVADRIRVSVVGLSAQVYICEDLCRRTNAGATAEDGDSAYSVAMHEQHFRELLLAATTPPATRQSQQQSLSSGPGGGPGAGGGGGASSVAPASLLMMGFPSRTASSDPALCACHNRVARQGYLCTRCGSRVCRLPAECPACGLTLILSTHLARSYHHLFPLRNWVEVGWAEAGRSAACFSCLAPFPDPRGRVSSSSGFAAGGAAGAAGGATAGAGAGAGRTDKGKGKAGAVPGATTGSHLTVPSAAASTAARATTRKAGPGGKSRADAHPALPRGVSESGRYMCRVCRNHFCIDCDVFAHEVIHNCPGCQSDTRDELLPGDEAAAAAATIPTAIISGAALNGAGATGGDGAAAAAATLEANGAAMVID